MSIDPLRNRVLRHAKAYRMLTRLFPAAFRSEYEEPMVQLFRDHFREALSTGQGSELILLWARVASDTFASLFREYLAALRRRFLGTKDPSPDSLVLMNAAPIRRRLPWYWIPTLAVVGGVIAAVFTALIPDQFRSTSTLIRTETADLSTQRPKLPPPSRDTVLSLAINDTVIHRVLGKLQDGVSNTNKLRRPALTVFEGPGGSFILSATSTNFAYSQTFAAAWVHELVDFVSQQRRNQINEAQALNTQHILTFQRRLEMAQQAQDAFQRKNNVGPNFAAELRQNHATARASLAALQEEQRRLETLPANGIGSPIPGNPGFDLRFEVRKLENRLAQSPTNSELKAELEIRKADLRSYAALVDLARKEQIDDLERRIAMASRHLKDVHGTELESVALVIEGARLEEEAARFKKQLDELAVQELEMSRFWGDRDLFQIIEAGGGSNSPVGPNRPYQIATGIGLGAIAGLLVVIGRSLTRGPDHSPATGPTTAPSA